jgi:FtsZ-binding cell division protein ZapB
MFSQELTVSKLVEKVNDLLVRFEELKAQNEALRQEVMTLKAQNEAKDAQILKLQEELTAKNIESDDILGRIEEVLRR